MTNSLMSKEKEIFVFKRFYIHNYFKSILCVVFLSILFSILGVLLSDVLAVDSIKRYVKHFDLLLLNTIPVTLVMLFIYHLTSRIWPSYFFGGGFFIIIQLINRFKIILREEPLTPSDLLLGMEVSKVVDFSSLPFSFNIILMCILFVLFGIFLMSFLRSDKLKWFVRLAGCLICIGLCLLSYTTLYNNGALYNKFPVKGNYYSAVHQFKSRGFIYSFLVKANKFKFLKPEGYSVNEVTSLLKSYTETPINNEAAKKLPHIFAMQAEAFYDLDRIPAVEFINGYKPLANFNSIKLESYSGRIITDVFGGGTANTEFSFLTGHSLSLLDINGMPYRTYIRKNTFALPRVLETKGYFTRAFHPGDSWYYNRTNVYNFFGFNEKYFKTDMDLSKVKTYNSFISDPDTMDFILDKFQKYLESKQEKPYFNFIVTIDNHWPYPESDVGLPKMLKRVSEMDDSQYWVVNNYINGIARADQALGYLVNEFRKSKEPIVLLFYADHLPYLGQNYKGYTGLNFNMGQSNKTQTNVLESYLNLYSTPYFIWSNDTAKGLLVKSNVPLLSGSAPEISVNYLATELLKYIGIDGGGYFNFLEEAKKAVPIVSNNYFKENGQYTAKLSENGKNLLNVYKKLQYYMMTDKEAIPAEVN